MNTQADALVALNAVKAMLATISVANGYNFDPTIKQGWLQHLFQARARIPFSFPVVAYRPELSAPDGERTGNAVVTDRITLVLDCAIAVKDTDTPVEDLFNLLKDVRRALVFDPHKNRMGIKKITFLECPFDVPEAGDEYAFFSQKISFEVTEQYA
uniref:hypothetical protein n=1 Tax=Marinobacterium profundum TaxID=1714300 RepID=UPI00082D6099|nr:hypothetical protein [Marinobacterium profundum]